MASHPGGAAPRRAAVLGATGMLGAMVARVLRGRGFDVWETQRAHPDAPGYLSATAPAAEIVRAFGQIENVDLVVNCVGATRVDLHPPAALREAVLVNAVFPHELAAATAGSVPAVVHISTDGVFRGGAEPYFEDSPPDAFDPYGVSKRLGETVEAPHFLSVRCSIVGPPGARGGGLLGWLLAQPAGAELLGFTNHVWNGVTTLQFAELAARLASRDAFHALRSNTPIVHFAPNQPITKYDLLRELARTFRPDVRVIPAEAPFGVRRVLRSRFERELGVTEHREPMSAAVTALHQFTHPPKSER